MWRCNHVLYFHRKAIRKNVFLKRKLLWKNKSFKNNMLYMVAWKSALYVTWRSLKNTNQVFERIFNLQSSIKDNKIQVTIPWIHHVFKKAFCQIFLPYGNCSKTDTSMNETQSLTHLQDLISTCHVHMLIKVRINCCFIVLTLFSYVHILFLTSSIARYAVVIKGVASFVQLKWH